MGSHPTHIGKYRVDGVIGGGGMGIVYRAFDPVLEVAVAIKVIRGAAEIKRFYVEAKSTASMRQCPNIVTVYDFGEQDGNPYLVMEYLEGISLDSIIKNRTPLNLSEKLRIIVDVLNGLSYAHDRNIIHRDIKPANIIVLNDGMAKIVDFGIARIGDTTGVTNPNTVLGTLEYMSPEAFQGAKLDASADVWSTSVVLYQLLTGKSPFKAETESNPAPVIHRVIHEDPPPLEHFMTEHVAEFQAILARGLAKKREERYGSAKEFALDLLQIQQQLKAQDAARYFEQGQAAVRSEEWERARRLFDEAVKIDPQNTTARRWLHQVTERLRIEQRRQQVLRLHEEANTARVERRFDDALALIDEAIHIDSTNQQLQALRAAVENDKNLQAKLHSSLETARTSLQRGQLQDAARAVQEVLAIAPQDTQARTLDGLIRKKLEERQRQENFKRLIEQARKQLATGDFAGTAASIEAARQIESTSPELSVLVSQLSDAQTRAERESELKQLNRQIEAAFEKDDYQTVIVSATTGLHKFPGERSLLDLKALAEEQLAQQTKKTYLNEQVGEIHSLMRQGNLFEARTKIEQALVRYPGELLLEHLRSDVLSKLEAADEKERQTRVLKQAQLETQRKKEFAEKLQQAIIRVPNLDQQLRLVEEALASAPDNELIRPIADAVRQRYVAFTAVLRQAHSLEESGDLAGALQQWRAIRREYPGLPGLEEQIQRISALEEQARAPKRAPEPISMTNLSATEVWTTGAAAPKLAPQPTPAVQERVPEVAAKAKPLKVVEPVVPIDVATKRPVAAPPPPKKTTPLIAIGAIVVCAVLGGVGYLLMSGGKAAKFTIETKPADAQIFVGSDPCASPCVLELKKGETKRLTAKRDGYELAEKELNDNSPNPFVLDLKQIAAGQPPVPAAESGKLAITANVDQYSVLIDGVNHGTSTGRAITISHEPGSFQVTLQKPGYESDVKQVEVAKNSERSVQFTLREKVGLENPYVTIAGKPGARVQVDNKYVGSIGNDGAFSYQVSPGSHQVRVDLSGYSPYSTSVSAKPGETKKVSVSMTAIPPSIGSFSASNSSIQQGQSTELSWQVRDASEVSIDPGVGRVGTSDNRSVTPSSTTTYTLTARNPEGTSVQKQVTVSVSAAAKTKPSILIFDSGNDTIRQGDKAKLTWATQNATEVTIEPYGPVQPPSAGSISVNPTKDTTYTLVAKSADGVTERKQIHITVESARETAGVPSTPTPTGNPEAKAVQDAIDRFRDAYESMSVDEERKTWVSMPSERAKADKELFNTFKAVRIGLRCGEPSISGDKATCSCSQSITFTNKSGKVESPKTASIQFQLKRVNGTWLIESMRGTAN